MKKKCGVLIQEYENVHALEKTFTVQLENKEIELTPFSRTVFVKEVGDENFLKVTLCYMKGNGKVLYLVSNKKELISKYLEANDHSIKIQKDRNKYKPIVKSEKDKDDIEIYTVILNVLIEGKSMSSFDFTKLSKQTKYRLMLSMFDLTDKMHKKKIYNARPLFNTIYIDDKLNLQALTGNLPSNNEEYIEIDKKWLLRQLAELNCITNDVFYHVDPSYFNFYSKNLNKSFSDLKGMLTKISYKDFYNISTSNNIDLDSELKNANTDTIISIPRHPVSDYYLIDREKKKWYLKYIVSNPKQKLNDYAFELTSSAPNQSGIEIVEIQKSEEVVVVPNVFGNLKAYIKKVSKIESAMSKLGSHDPIFLCPRLELFMLNGYEIKMPIYKGYVNYDLKPTRSDAEKVIRIMRKLRVWHSNSYKVFHGVMNQHSFFEKQEEIDGIVRLDDDNLYLANITVGYLETPTTKDFVDDYRFFFYYFFPTYKEYYQPYFEKHESLEKKEIDDKMIQVFTGLMYKAFDEEEDELRKKNLSDEYFEETEDIKMLDYINEFENIKKEGDTIIFQKNDNWIMAEATNIGFVSSHKVVYAKYKDSLKKENKEGFYAITENSYTNIIVYSYFPNEKQLKWIEENVPKLKNLIKKEKRLN